MPNRARSLVVAALLSTACTRDPGVSSPPDAAVPDAGPPTSVSDAADVGSTSTPPVEQPTHVTADAGGLPSSALPGPCASVQDVTPVSIQPVAPADKTRLSLQPDPGLGGARLYKRVDLNADGSEDLLLRFPGACGTEGECPIGIYLNCDGERYARLWGPEYAVDLDVQRGKGPWLEFKWSQSAGGGKATLRVLRFAQGAYQEPEKAR